MKLARWAEPVAFAVGALLRLALPFSYDPRWSYDYAGHWGYTRYVAEHAALPPVSLSNSSYHPPLWYWLTGVLARWGHGPAAAQWISVMLGMGRLGVLWLGLRVLLPEDRFARVLALVLAGVLPCAVHLDGMVTNESLNALLGTAALLLLALALASEGRRRWWLSLGLLAALILQLSTKVSGLIPLGLTALGAGLEWLRARDLRRLVPIGSTVVLTAAVILPAYWVRNREVGRLIVSSPYQSMKVGIDFAAPTMRIPYWKRQPAIYPVGLGRGEVFVRPWWPSDIDRFWPVLVATTFGDYYNNWYSGPVDTAEPFQMVNDRPMNDSTVALQRLSVAAGAVIALTVLVALVAASVWAVRRRDLVVGLLLLAPILATLGQLHIAIEYPFRHAGMIKAHYIQFAAGPLFGLFGLSVSWLARRPRRRVVAALPVVALLLVAAYSIDARTGWYR